MAIDITKQKVEPMHVSWGALDLGAIDGSIELTYAIDTVDLTSHQTGSQVLDQVVVGKNLEAISLTLKETDAAKLEALIAATGASHTPAAGTEVVGMGTGNNFTVMSSLGEKLVFHPVRLGAGVLTDDIAFWNAVPLVEGMSFNPDSVATVTVSFRIYPDFTKEEGVNIWVRGDHTQDFAL